MTVKIALLGFGTVASGVPFLLKENGGKINQSAHSDIKVAKVLVKDEDEKNRLLAAGNDFNFVTNVDDILSDQDITIVVELMGRIEPAKTFITRALEAGKHVVTANKDLLAVHGAELLEIAQANKVALYYEAAVAGGIPILRTLANSLASDKGDGGSLVVYSPNSEGLIGATIPAFEEKYGIKVELIQAGTGELFKKLESEKEVPVADVIFGGSYTQYTTHGELFENYTSKENDNVIKEYQNTTGYSTPYTLDGSVLIVNPDLTKGMNIEGYNDLFKPELKGKIATADPANSSSAFAQLTNMLQAQGGYKDDKAWSYVKDLFTLIDGKIGSSSSSVYKVVADGEMAVGLSYEDPAVKLLNDGANIKVVYPKEGTVFLPASAAIVKKSKNMENAKKFIDFIISQEVQDTLGTTTTNRPVRKNAKTSENMKPIDKIKTLTEDYDYVIKNKSDIVKKYNEVFTDIQSKQ